MKQVGLKEFRADFRDYDGPVQVTNFGVVVGIYIPIIDTPDEWTRYDIDEHVWKNRYTPASRNQVREKFGDKKLGYNADRESIKLY